MGRDKRRRRDERRKHRQIGGGGVRSEETGQPTQRMRGTKGDAAMRGAGRWGNNRPDERPVRSVTSDKWPESSVSTADGSLMARYGGMAP